MITVILADDHHLIRNVVQSLLTKVNDVKFVTAVATAEDAIAQVNLHLPHVVIMDIAIPIMGGLEAAKQISAFCPSTRVLMLSGYDYPSYIQRALQVNAFGYVLKDDTGKELMPAIRAIHAGHRYFSQKIASLAEQYQDGNESLRS